MPESPGLYLRLSVVENLACFADLYEMPEPSGADRARPSGGQPGRPGGRPLRHAVQGPAPAGRPGASAAQRPRGAVPRRADLRPRPGRRARRPRADRRAPASAATTIFLTTHRLEEAERLCDRVAILNTTLRTIGRPDELRDQLFARTLTVRTRAPLGEPGRVFGGPGRASSRWHHGRPRAPTSSPSPTRPSPPRGHPGARRCRRRRAVDRRSPITRSRMSTSS